MRHFIRRMIFCVFLFWSIGIVIPMHAYSAVHYVSPTGTATWAESTDRNSPCDIFDTAMQNAQAGDTVIFLDGIYEHLGNPDWEQSMIQPSNSGTEGNPIIFRSENPLGAELVVRAATTKAWKAIGSYNRDWIVIDGFKVYGRNRITEIVVGGSVMLYNADNITIKNCEIIGITHSASGTNVEGIRINDSKNVAIENCKIHGFVDSSNHHNTSAYKLYDSSNVIVENCTIYDCTAALYDKQGGYNNTYRYNLIYNCNHGFYIQSAGVNNGNHEIYQNIFVNNSSTAIRHPSGDSHASDNMQVYNNVVYGGYRGFARGDAGDWSYWNNIVVTRGYSFTGFKEYGRPDYSDYQCFYDGQNFEVNLYVAGEATYTSLADWKSSGKLIGGGNPDLHSIYQNPLFVDPENYDFRLQSGSPCKGTGKDGKDMGAYPNGDDGTVIGYTPPGSPSRPDKRTLWLSH